MQLHPASKMTNHQARNKYKVIYTEHGANLQYNSFQSFRDTNFTALPNYSFISFTFEKFAAALYLFNINLPSIHITTHCSQQHQSLHTQ
jgi:hypothetical protein